MTSHVSREVQIIHDAAKTAGVTFPSLDRYADFTPPQKYIAHLASQIRSAEAAVEQATDHVRSNLDRAAANMNSLGVIQGSGPLLDVHVATLVERRANLVMAMRMLCPEVDVDQYASDMADADRRMYGHA